MQTSAHSLFGREQDVARLGAFVKEAAEDGGAVLVTGDAGVGKTALVNVVAAQARQRGVRVLRAAGTEFEAALSFAGLNQLLLHPVLDQLRELDDIDQRALRMALGLAEGRASDELAVSNATLRLLAALANDQPPLVVVDDVNWLDRASSAVLAYVARRVGGTRVALIATMRSGERTPFERGGLATYELQPLSEAEAMALLQARFPSLTLHARGRLLAEAAGNPLALLELPIALNVGSARTAALPRVLPLTQRLEQVFASRLDPLPPESREALLLAVLDGTGELAVVAPRGVGTDALAAAERARLVYIDDTTGRLVFQHPLIRSAVIQRSTGAERRRAHQLLAERRLNDPERQAWHLAEAAVEPDERVAALLQHVAHRHLWRGDAVGAIAELLRAAELSPSGEGRGIRLAEAAYWGATVNGDLQLVPRLMEEARRSDPEHAGAFAGAVAGAYHLLNDDGEIDLAHRLLVGAIESVPDPTDATNKQLHEALYSLLVICFFGGRTELWEPLHAALRRLDPGPPELLAILVQTFGDPVRADAAMLGRLDRQIDELRTEPTPARTVRVAIAAAYLDRLGGCRAPLRRVVEVGREGGAITSAIEALFLLGNDAYFSGRWDELEALTGEGLALCDEYGYRLLSWPGLFLRALLAAARGETETARELADDMTRWANPRAAGSIKNYAAHVQTILALGQGEYEAAFRHAATVSPAGALPPHAPHALWLAMDLVEAAVRSNRGAEAAAHVEALRREGVALLSPRLALATEAAEAMTAPDDVKRARFEQVLGGADVQRWPFEHARVELAYGEHLRRARVTGEARVHLMHALDGFRLLGAQPWMDKAASELRAAGASVGRPAPAAGASFTPQQREIAQLAAQGLTNKQIGERLFLSHRTIATHLYQLYPKLGITSRAALSDALAQLAEDEVADPLVRTPPG